MESRPPNVQQNGTGPATKEVRDRALASAFRENDFVWLVQERYDPQFDAWNVDFVYQSMMGRWMRKRYRYDGPSGVVYFLGERPVSEEELTSLRRTAKVFPVAELRRQSNQ
ncbi:MAG: hypothetical protein ACLFVO_07985 [Chloroflexaceae bacterium]|jgi:hypothetical protein